MQQRATDQYRCLHAQQPGFLRVTAQLQMQRFSVQLQGSLAADAHIIGVDEQILGAQGAVARLEIRHATADGSLLPTLAENQAKSADIDSAEFGERLAQRAAAYLGRDVSVGTGADLM